MGTTIAAFKEYILNGQFFKTKASVQCKIKSILYQYPVGTSVNREDFMVLLDLIENHHPEPERKISCGIDSIEVRISPCNAKQRCFYLIRADGSQDDFSYLKCINPPPPLRTFKVICRKLVSRQMYMHKWNYFNRHQRADGRVQCPVTGGWVCRDESHVDHIPPFTFDRLVLDFIVEHGIDVSNVELEEACRENKVGKTFADEVLAGDWIQYHKQHAKLRVVSILANMTVIRKIANAMTKQSSLQIKPAQHSLW